MYVASAGNHRYSSPSQADDQQQGKGSSAAVKPSQAVDAPQSRKAPSDAKATGSAALPRLSLKERMRLFKQPAQS